MATYLIVLATGVGGYDGKHVTLRQSKEWTNSGKPYLHGYHQHWTGNKVVWILSDMSSICSQDGLECDLVFFSMLIDWQGIKSTTGED